MIRLTFITGAGKLGRQKYDENAAKAVTNALRPLGFVEDRGASAVLACAGSFKMQHDTGKNLKTVVVFPKVVPLAEGDDDGDGAALPNAESLIPVNTPEHKLAYSSIDTFKRNIPPKCQTWSQKKACIAALQGLKELVQGLEQKLLKGTVLTDSEQECYDLVSLSSLDAKISHVRDLMHEQVDKGQLTQAEIDMLLEQVRARISKLNDSKQDGLKTKALERQTKLEEMTAKPAPPLSQQAAISRLRQEMAPLLEVEAKAKGRLLSLKESQTVARKTELMEEITELEERSRGWFESDEAFDDRVKRSRAAGQRKQKTSSKAASGGGAARVPTSTNWVTPGTAPGWKGVTKKKTNNNSKSKPSQPGGLFAAMMDDSDSD